jgi:hypothetical protein
MTPATATPPTSVREIDGGSTYTPLARAQPAGEASLATFEASLQSFTHLQEGWDSYGAVAPTRLALLSAAWFVSQLAGSGPVPQLFPTRRGGVQLEWHTPHTHLEWEIYPEGTTGLFVFDNEATGETVDGDLPADSPRLRLALGQVFADR